MEVGSKARVEGGSIARVEGGSIARVEVGSIKIEWTCGIINKINQI